MKISVRLPGDLDRALARAAMAQGVSKSTIVRQCLAEYLRRHNSGNAAWALGKDLFGRVGSGRADLSRNGKRTVRAKILATKNRR